MTQRAKPDERELTAELETLCLRALASEYDQLNYELFKKSLKRPALRFIDSKTRLGLWEAEFATISLARHLLLEGSWGVLLEVLKHEMAHQFVSEVLRVDEPAHGPAFVQVCLERGIDGRAAGNVEAPPNAPSHAVLAKVRGLLALAESKNHHEAEAAMSAAQRLMLKHNLEQVNHSEEKGYHFLHLGKPSGRIEESARALATILREFFFVEILWVSVYRPLEAKWGSVLEVCGTSENLELAEYVYDFLTRTAEHLWRVHKREHRIARNRDRRKYIAGVMAGFYDKLRRERGKNQSEGLLWLGDAKLKSFFRKRYPKTRSVSYGTSGGTIAYAEGRKAGAQIVLHKGVSSGPKGPTRLLKG